MDAAPVDPPVPEVPAPLPAAGTAEFSGRLGLADRKIAQLVGQGARVLTDDGRTAVLTLEGGDGQRATVDAWGKVTWTREKPEEDPAAAALVPPGGLPALAAIRASTGRDLDALAAEHLLGWLWRRDQEYVRATGAPCGPPFRFLVAADDLRAVVPPWDGVEEVEIDWNRSHGIPQASADHNAAALVLAVMRKLGWHWLLHPSGGDAANRVAAVFTARSGFSHVEFADSIPEAVVRAALGAISLHASRGGDAGNPLTP